MDPLALKVKYMKNWQHPWYLNFFRASTLPFWHSNHILISGQTFSGKTYTMGSDNTQNTAANDHGIIPRVFNDIFENLKTEDGMVHLVKISFLEIYQEQVGCVN